MNQQSEKINKSDKFKHPIDIGIKDTNPDITAKTNWHFTIPNGGWKLGTRIVKWKNRDFDEFQLQMWRTNKNAEWVPGGKPLYITFENLKQLRERIFKDVLAYYINIYSKTKTSKNTIKSLRT